MACILGCVFFGLYFLLPLLLPFAIGLCIAAVISPVTRKLVANMRFKPKAAAVFATAGFYLLLSLVLWLFGLLFYYQTSNLILHLPQFYQNTILPVVDKIVVSLSGFISGISATDGGQLARFWSALGTSSGEWAGLLSAGAVDLLSKWLATMPIMGLTVVFSIITSFIISLDYNNVVAFLTRQLPRSARKVLLCSKGVLLRSVFKMLRAYTMLLLLTFSELCLGLALLGVRYYVTVAAIIAILDILPIIGSGAVLVPWAIIELVLGNTPLGVGLLVLWGVVGLVRNIAEPKIIGHQIGLHPLVTITAMYFGLKVAGFAGLVAAPLTILLLVHLNRSGAIKLYK